ncbi:MAG: PSD1 domain-containing protein [Planctomycetaceae bacterium]|nr:PSD1 domain-containing protein [Planctomycetaceae bacterium]
MPARSLKRHPRRLTTLIVSIAQVVLFPFFTVAPGLTADGFAADELPAGQLQTQPGKTELSPDSETAVMAEQIEFFETNIRPVLVEHCYQCHAVESKSIKGGLRLDTAAAIREGGDSGAAIDPDSPGDSLLLSAIRYEGLEMPPSGRLPDKIIQDFERWIANGAVDPRKSLDGEPGHPTGQSTLDADLDIEEGRSRWAFQIPRMASDLQIDGKPVTDSARIDALIDRRLHDAGIQRNPPAEKRVQIRRLSFDLTGLPPTVQDVEAFVADESPDAVARVVDRLLNSSAYGERWARVWLDVARYAEDQAHIVGNNKELFYPNAWRYREWVINALNSDLPYDRFVTLQLAADIIDPEDTSGHVALGFIGLGPKYYRRNDPEVMAEEWEDRVDVVSRGLQGLTVACARCHDHKYDPVRTEDYYALAGVFAGTEMFNKPMDGVEIDGKGLAKKPEDAIHIVRDGKPRDLNVMIRGNVNNKGAIVPRGFLEVMFDGERRLFQKGSGRAELAAAITDPSNPLTARVIVNRIWQQYFGNGIVRIPSNFGQLGEAPTHPELLDDLAARFMQNGWSLKWLHRQIALSETYLQSSDIHPTAAQIDATNSLLWRMPRRRLSIEFWRDAVLAVSGQLEQSIGGPSLQPDDPNQNRRTIYSEISRFDLNPMLARFDFPDPNTHAAKRTETNTPLQKLFLLNNPFVTKHAAAIGERVQQTLQDNAVEKSLSNTTAQLFTTVLQRRPTPEESAAMEQYLASLNQDSQDVAAPDRLTLAAQALLSSNEFWWLD